MKNMLSFSFYSKSTVDPVYQNDEEEHKTEMGSQKFFHPTFPPHNIWYKRSNSNGIR